MKTVRFAVIGIRGYSLVHLEAIRWLENQGKAQLTGVVALPEERELNRPLLQQLRDRGISLYDSIDHILDAGIKAADVLTVPIGIHQHIPVSIRALKKGFHVYCEKPLTGDIREVEPLYDVLKETGRRMVVGYQYLYSPSVQFIKKLIGSGRLGSVRRVYLICGWPRSKQYYQRNPWAGRLCLGNQMVLDSPANNAHAHFLMNLQYLCHPAAAKAALPRKLRAELYRVNDIESADLVQLELETETGAEGYVCFTHCNESPFGPQMRIECEEGTILWEGEEGDTTISLSSDETLQATNRIDPYWRYRGFEDIVHAIHENRIPLSTPQMAFAQTAAVHLMHQSCPEIWTIPPNHVQEKEDQEMPPLHRKGLFRHIPGLNALMKKLFENWEFFSEMNLEWAKGVNTNPVEFDCRTNRLST